MTAVKRCTCKHEYQDKKYGRGLRVYNTFKAKNGNMRGRCTVCKAEKEV